MRLQRANRSKTRQREGQLDALARRASAIFGSEVEARRWLNTPAMALDQKRPADLVRTASGRQAVEAVLVRLEFGVYT